MATHPLDRLAMLGEEWKVNATRQWNILLHPLGELNAGDYIFQASDNVEEMRQRSRGVYMQLFINVIVFYIFTRNFVHSAKMLCTRCNSVPNWCCIIQTLAGLVFSAFSLSLVLPGGASCRTTMWCVAVCFVCSTLCTSTALLHKAFLAHGRHAGLLVLGILLMLPQPYIIYVMWSSPTTVDGSIGCLLHYPASFPWIKFGMDAPLNIIFSIAFLIVIHQHYKQFGSSAWGELIRNGTQTMCYIIISNIVCMTLAAFEIAGLFSEMFFVFDWIITSFLLVQHCETFHNQSNLSMKPKTIAILQGFSQIITAITQVGSEKKPSNQYTDTEGLTQCEDKSVNLV
ncbi:hypothetical protein BDF19DRAFT_426197 [Syncephalis fuscata]|nr:hypothetical protein BDF19DRAFT_426197 [Syncephalis fuscata]